MEVRAMLTREKKSEENGPNVRVGVVDQGDVLQARAELVRTVLVEETIERRAARATVEPEDDRVGGGIAGGRNEEVVVVLLGVGDVQVTRIHGNELGIL